ncbi:MAG: hypothetical protein ACR2MX_05450 [Cyclobacteriaceae bacterium]
MAEISIAIDVLNPEEVVKHQKGKFIGSLLTTSMSHATLKKKVEKEVCKRVIAELKEHLDEAFKNEGIAAHLKITTNG